MIIKSSKTGSSMSLSDAPKITFDGKWLKWHLEFYNGVAYWEAWFLSSGTLTVTGSYKADLWGIGGGASTYWGSGGGTVKGCKGGHVARTQGETISGSIPITIGAGAKNSGINAGGATKLGSVFTCLGGEVSSDFRHSGDPNRYRFMDPEKTEEKGADVAGDGVQSAGGWLPLAEGIDQNGKSDASAGQGFGGGGGYFGYAKSGALVMRILA